MNDKPELLAPAGSPETFAAAFRAGADAFYLGVGDFNARKRARNFSREEIKEATLFAHRNGRRVYITLNTLLFDDEFPGVIDLLSFLEDIRVDGIIVQDLGLMSLLRNHFPSIPIHASTQMFCHNSQQALYLKNAGARRVILARELSLEEIRSIIAMVPLEYEVFVHGAMCFSFSGCCLFSSHLYGDSGNRGRCRQPCRLPFEGARGKSYPFSMKDLSAASLVGELVASGASAFKIEGRLRNAAYVSRAVRMYRSLIDASPVDRTARRKEGKAAPGSTRESEGGYFHGREYRRLVAADRPGGSGEELGGVISAAGSLLVFTSGVEIGKGSRLRVVDAEGRMLHEGTLLEYSRPREGTYEWRLPVKAPRAKGMRVYLTGESRTFGEWPAIRREAALHKFIPVRLEIRLSRTAIEARAVADDLAPFEFARAVETNTARTRAVTTADIEDIFARTDRYPFLVEKRHVDIEPDIFVRLGALKALRRELYELLYAHYEAGRDRRDAERKTAILAEMASIRDSSTADERLYLEYADLESGEPADFRIIEFESIGAAMRPCPEEVILLPLFVSGERLAGMHGEIAGLVAAGHRRFMIPTYGWIEFFSRYDELELFGGPFLYAVNSMAYAEIVSRGVRHFSVSPDMHNERIVTISYRGHLLPRTFRKELMATRLRLPDTCYRGAKATIRVARFAEYDVVFEDDK
ncbi:MAG TPA: U32 family peptidase [Spirochaetota bacterium]|nr:U32 family peptidase [Spirochaetota bacterium]